MRRAAPLAIVTMTLLALAVLPARAATPATVGDLPGMTITYGPVQCGGGYPPALCTPPALSRSDKWGFPNRGCNSYVVWLEASMGRQVPTRAVDGRSNLWPRRLASWVVPKAAAGEIAVLPRSPTDPTLAPGHAFYIERVTTNGDLVVRQYNWEDSRDFTIALVNPTLLEKSRQAGPMVYLEFPAVDRPSS